jgi:hypothetical protein
VLLLGVLRRCAQLMPCSLLCVFKMFGILVRFQCSPVDESDVEALLCGGVPYCCVYACSCCDVSSLRSRMWLVVLFRMNKPPAGLRIETCSPTAI